MKDSNTKKIIFLNVLLNIISGSILLSLISPIYSFYSIIIMNDKSTRYTIPTIIFAIIFLGSYLMIISALKKVIKSISLNNAFTLNNVTYFKKIGYYILTVGVIDAIINYPKPNNTGIHLLLTSYGSLKPIFFLYIILSLLAFILADIFKMAIDIKEENDLTI